MKLKKTTQLQRFLGSLNYVGNFYKDLHKLCKPLYDRLKRNPPSWSQEQTDVVKLIKSRETFTNITHSRTSRF